MLCLLRRRAARLFARGRPPRKPTMTTLKTEPASPTADEDHFWHLARSATGVAVTDFEFALMRTAESFARWQSECLAAVTGAQLSGAENAMLHVICMHAQPKTVRELMQMTNRGDLANVQYGLRKLMQLGFVTKSGSARKGVFYAGTSTGIQVCEDYARLREKLLLRGAEGIAEFTAQARQVRDRLEVLERLYESVTREVATFHRRRLGGLSTGSSESHGKISNR